MIRLFKYFPFLLFLPYLHSAENCIGEYELNNWTNYCKGVYEGRFERYEGTFYDNRYSGNGILIVYSSGLKYEGEFLNDEFHGYGKISNPQNYKYEGYWKNNLKHGEGKLELISLGDEEKIYQIEEGIFFDGYLLEGATKNLISGDIFEGFFNKKGRLEGEGYFISNRTKFSGNFKDGLLDGNGKILYQDGSFYEGNFLNGLESGTGTLKFPSGENYEGDWRDGLYDGKGKYTYGTGQIYEGDFKNHEPSGKGKTIYENGTIHEGDYLKGSKNGFGRETYGDGSIYEGFYELGEWKGEGIFVNSDGCITKGNWESTYIINGFGTYKCSENSDFEDNKNEFYFEGNFEDGFFKSGKYVFSDGRVYEGDFEMDLFTKGKLTFPSGDVYVGEFKNDLMSGYGSYSFSNGDKFIGNFRNDLFDGVGTYVYANGEKISGTWVHDKFISEEFTQNSSFLELNEKELIKSIQELLKKIGYDPGEINGELGIKSSSAISAFQQSRNKNITGKPSQELLVQLQIELRKITSLSFAQPQSSSKDEIYPVQATGTGFYTSENIIVTNYHVIEGCDYLTINYQEKISILKLDEVNDLAILKSNKKNSSFLTLSNDVAIGEAIYVGGFPHNLELGNFNFTVGNVSSLSGISRNFSEFQFTAPIQPGNSGGPILNNKGGVVGITVSSLDDVYFLTESGTVPQNANFGIKVSILKEIMREIDLSFAAGDKFWFWGSSKDLADLSKRSSVLINCHQKEKS